MSEEASREPCPDSADDDGDGDDAKRRRARARATRLAAERRKRRAYGWTGPHDRVPTDTVREALERLRGAGFTNERVSELLGIDDSTIIRVLGGQRGEVTAATARKVLAADIDRILETEPRSSRRVDAAPYREHLRRLRAAGWRRIDLERMAGIRPGEENVWRDRCRYIGPGLAERLDELFRDIGWRTGGDAASMRFWRSRGYGPPAAYDEDGNLVEEWMLPTPPRAREPRVVPR